MMFAGLQRLAAGLLLLAAIFMFYEGVPGLSSVPYIGHIPLVGAIAEGRVASAARAAGERAVASEKATASAEREQLVLETEKAALAAQLAESNRQRQAGARTLEEYRKRLDAQVMTDEAERLAQEKAIEEDNTNDDGARVSPSDLEWLRQHGG